MTLSLLISAVLQLILFSIIPYTYWFFTSRTTSSFAMWIGWKKPQLLSRKQFILWFILTMTIFTSLGMLTAIYMLDKNTLASSQFYGTGLKGLIPALIYSWLQTSLSEEILFRGFIGKRLSSKFGFGIGNCAQALLFGVVHAVLLYSSSGLLNSAVVMILTGFVGWSIGMLDEKLSGGSIFPGWVLHGLTNLISTIFMMYQWM
ncbi:MULTISPECIES: CPBP family intramembrane glutamic endopeptidase [unclassified Paenibacillus]|uniref:CPBP family intramembrane glutamic endopeptidase n=1 Tax=unclassified Paenibacillus TaxID=185978 RepID=UPI0030EC11E0